MTEDKDGTEHAPPADVEAAATDPGDPERRVFLSRATGVAMAGGLVAGYGSLGAIAAQYLYPSRPAATAWMFVAHLAGFPAGTSRGFTTPAGAPIVIARQGHSGDQADFVALSSTCPHLGCRVHWQTERDRFFCPCHNGTFDRSGNATGGPPAEAKQSLPRYPLRVDRGLLFIEVPVEELG